MFINQVLSRYATEVNNFQVTELLKDNILAIIALLGILSASLVSLFWHYWLFEIILWFPHNNNIFIVYKINVIIIVIISNNDTI